jgi:hypothetical protein
VLLYCDSNSLHNKRLSKWTFEIWWVIVGIWAWPIKYFSYFK